MVVRSALCGAFRVYARGQHLTIIALNNHTAIYLRRLLLDFPVWLAFVVVPKVKVVATHVQAEVISKWHTHTIDALLIVVEPIELIFSWAVVYNIY
jgi:hypothetical protein